jgi:hypothetical protein
MNIHNIIFKENKILKGYGKIILGASVHIGASATLILIGVVLWQSL